MAQYSHLPIYKKAYDLALLVHEITEAFPKKNKYSLGDLMRKSSLHIVKLIVSINSCRDIGKKQEFFDVLFSELHELLLYFRLAKDMKTVISNAQQEKVVVVADEVVRQTAGWKKSFDAKGVLC